jgi:hypothetical protein
MAPDLPAASSRCCIQTYVAHRQQAHLVPRAHSHVPTTAGPAATRQGRRGLDLLLATAPPDLLRPLETGWLFCEVFDRLVEGSG